MKNNIISKLLSISILISMIFGPSSRHVTMYIGNSKLVQESRPGTKCNIANLSDATGTLLGYRRCWK